MKRNRLTRPATIGLIGLTAFTLAACQEEVLEVPMISSASECTTSIPGATPEECKAAIDQAHAEHQATAPRYDAVAVCEEQHGAGNCVADNSSGGGSIFMPILMGYMMGSLMSKLGGGAAAGAANARSVPMYPGAGGGLQTADGSTKVASGSGTAKVGPQAFKAQPTTLGKAPMSSATVRSTGGFGNSTTSGGRTSSGGGGFGG